MKINTLLAALALASAAFGGDVKTPTVMNIVNFVRGSEPRYPDLDLVLPLREEVKLNTQYHLPNTILLQYDAMLRDDLVAAAKSAEQDKTEYGVWFELCRQVVEKCGIKWAGRPGWDWEWFVNPGFLMAYEPAERERIVDETFRLFKVRFGAYPRVIGSWLLDAHSMNYMAEKYGVDGFCICREQDSTDAYGLRGGYSNGLYYPSKVNAISPAVDMKNAIPVPLFRMLTPDPIYNYGPGHNDRTGLVKSRYPGVCTLEPISAAAQRPEIVDWYFRVYTGSGLLGLSYMQAGQENSFGWPAISRGLPYQIKKIASLAAEGKIVVETMGDTGRKFKAKHRENIPQTQVALENWSDEDYKSVWYNSKHYRINVFYKEGHLRIRDIHKFCDDYPETYLKKACKKWHCSYFTPPVVDAVMFAKDGESGIAEFGGTFNGLSVATPDEKTLVVTATRPDGLPPLTIACREDRIDFDMGVTTDDWARAGIKFRGAGCNGFFDSLDFPSGSVVMTFDGCRYEMPYYESMKWSDARRRGFEKVLSFANRPVAHFAPMPKGERRLSALEGWLKALPKPAGVFAVNDFVALEVLAAATRCGIDVPRDLCVVGMDNDLVSCENALPTLTSVKTDFGHSGVRAVELVFWMRANPKAPPKCLTYAGHTLVRRQSTRRAAASDPVVGRAVEWIRLNATSPVGVNDVAKAVGTARRTLEQHFRKAIGRSVLDVLRETRLDAAFELLRNPRQSIGAVANLCGYDSELTLRRIFVSSTGMTPRAWRAANAKCKSLT